MSIITSRKNIFYDLKSTYLKNVLKLSNQNGKLFTHILSRTKMKTFFYHTLWFTETNGSLNRFFPKKMVLITFGKIIKMASYLFQLTKVQKKFANGEKAVRSIFCCWVNIMTKIIHPTNISWVKSMINIVSDRKSLTK